MKTEVKNVFKQFPEVCGLLIFMFLLLIFSAVAALSDSTNKERARVDSEQKLITAFDQGEISLNRVVGDPTVSAAALNAYAHNKGNALQALDKQGCALLIDKLGGGHYLALHEWLKRSIATLDNPVDAVP